MSYQFREVNTPCLEFPSHKQEELLIT